MIKCKDDWVHQVSKVLSIRFFVRGRAIAVKSEIMDKRG